MTFKVMIQDEHAAGIMLELVQAVKADARISQVLLVETEDGLIAGIATALANSGLKALPAVEKVQVEEAAAAGSLPFEAAPVEPAAKRRRRSKAEMAMARAVVSGGDGATGHPLFLAGSAESLSGAASAAAIGAE